MLLLSVTNKTLYITDSETNEQYELVGTLSNNTFKANKGDLTYTNGTHLDENAKEDIIQALMKQMDTNKFKLLIL